MEPLHERFMAGQAEPDLARRVVLANTPALSLGDLRIEPSLRRVANADGREEIVEPRVMQVLVALILADGRILARDELLTRCWHGVVVGDDAINRVIGRLRRLADGIGGGAFKLETITKVGFRMVQVDRLDQSPPRRSIDPPIRVVAPPLLAVLPFDNLSGDPEMSWFSDGISEEIQQTVARRADMKVIGRTSSFQFRGEKKGVAGVAAELGATHVLDGAVRKSGGHVRISAQLIDCADQTTLWSNRFDRELVDILVLQDEIAGAVASALKATFVQSASPGRIDEVAHDIFLEALSSSGPEHVHIGEAIRLLERAVSLAPDFAPAWAALAHRRVTVYRRISMDEMHFTVSRQEASAAAETALRLDPKSGLARTSLAHMLPWGDHCGREAGSREAVAASPNDTLVITEMGWFLMSMGRYREALGYGEHAIALDPLNGWAVNMYAQALVSIGRYDEGQLCLDRHRRRQPFSRPSTSVALYLAATKEDWFGFDRLRRIVKDMQLSDRNVRAALGLGKILREPSNHQERILALITEEKNKTGAVELQLLSVACKIGLVEEVFSLVETMSFAHLDDPEGAAPAGAFSPGIIFLPDLSRSMMKDARFVRLCDKLGFCDYWVGGERWLDCADFLPYDLKAEARRLVEARSPV